MGHMPYIAPTHAVFPLHDCYLVPYTRTFTCTVYLGHSLTQFLYLRYPTQRCHALFCSGVDYLPSCHLRTSAVCRGCYAARLMPADCGGLPFVAHHTAVLYLQRHARCEHEQHSAATPRTHAGHTYSIRDDAHCAVDRADTYPHGVTLISCAPYSGERAFSMPHSALPTHTLRRLQNALPLPPPGTRITFHTVDRLALTRCLHTTRTSTPLFPTPRCSVNTTVALYAAYHARLL